MLKRSDLETQLAELQKWFEENPKLPSKIEPIVLRRFYKCMSYEFEATKKIIELNYGMRNKNGNIFLERNPEDEPTANGLRASDLIILPGVTPERHKVLLFRMADFDPSSRDSIEESKIFFMMTDARFTMPDCNELMETNQKPKSDANKDVLDIDIADGDVQIVDIHGYTMRHLARISFFVLRVYMKFLQEAYPSRLRAMHIINCPAFLDKMIAFVKPFIREEVYRVIKFHTEGLESLYAHVPRDMLPEEYGGKAGKVSELKAYWIEQLKMQKNYLRDEQYWRVAPSQDRSRWSWF